MRRSYRAVDYCFTLAVEGNDALDGYLQMLFGGFPTAAPSADVVQWTVRPVDLDDGAGWEFVIGDARRATAEHAGRLVQDMVQALNSESVATWDGVVCHAGGVSARGNGILLPADPESGKTTLTCGLVRAGFSYLTDEGVAFRPGTDRIEPYPKPLSLDPGSWFLFPELEPQWDFDRDDYKRDQWQVAPTAIRADAVGGSCRARLVVFPKYVEDGATELAPLSRAQALLDLAKNTFSFNQQSRFALEELTRVVHACDCYRLTVGTLDDAVACIEELAAALPDA